MKSGIIVLSGCIILSSCNPIKDSMQDAVTGNLEKVIESQTGAKVDLGDADAYSENLGSVEFIADERQYLKKREKLQAVALFQKDEKGLNISFQLTGEEGKSLVVIVSHIPENFTLPIKARFAVSNNFDGENPVATLLFMHADENGMLSTPIPYEGVLTINRLSEMEMTFEVQAQGGYATETDSPASWKPVIVSGVLKSPIIQTFGIDKQNVLR